MSAQMWVGVILSLANLVIATVNVQTARRGMRRADRTRALAQRNQVNAERIADAAEKNQANAEALLAELNRRGLP